MYESLKWSASRRGVVSWSEIAQWALMFYGVLLIFFARAFYVYRRRDDEVSPAVHSAQGFGDDAR
jgi:hypothetical protein